MRRFSSLAVICPVLGLVSALVSGCATFGGGTSDTGRKYVVFFTKGSAHIDGPGRAVISHAAAVAQRHPDRAVIVAGYAAAHGSLDADAAISAARANAVAYELQSDGVRADRVTVHARPPSNEDPGVAARRVEIGLVSQH